MKNIFKNIIKIINKNIIKNIIKIIDKYILCHQVRNILFN